MKTDYIDYCADYYNDKEWYACTEWTFITDHGMPAHMRFEFGWLEVRVGPPGSTREYAKKKGKIVFDKKVKKDTDFCCGDYITAREAFRIIRDFELPENQASNQSIVNQDEKSALKETDGQ